MASVAALLLIPTAGAHAQFFASTDTAGDIAVEDEAGAEVPLVTSEVGQRPDVCPNGSYHIAQLPTDISQLVLTDCATGQGQFTVERREPGAAGSD